MCIRDRGYVNDLQVAGNKFSVTQAELELQVKETEIKVLKEFTRQMQLETMQGGALYLPSLWR